MKTHAFSFTCYKPVKNGPRMTCISDYYALKQFDLQTEIVWWLTSSPRKTALLNFFWMPTNPIKFHNDLSHRPTRWRGSAGCFRRAPGPRARSSQGVSMPVHCSRLEQLPSAIQKMNTQNVVFTHSLTLSNTHQQNERIEALPAKQEFLLHRKKTTNSVFVGLALPIERSQKKFNMNPNRWFQKLKLSIKNEILCDTGMLLSDYLLCQGGGCYQAGHLSNHPHQYEASNLPLNPV